MSGMTPDRGELLSRYRTALVHIEVTGVNAEGRPAPQLHGAGVVIGSNGLIITAGHVIGKDEHWAETAPGSGVPRRTIKITGLNERQVSYDLGEASVQFIPGCDLALLRVNARPLQAVLLANESPSENSSVVALLWESKGVPQAVTAELVTTDWARNPGLTVMMQVLKGHSGSGLFDGQSRLTGIITNRIDDRLALAIPIAWIKSQIESQLPRALSTEDNGRDETPADGSRGPETTVVESLPQQLEPVKRELSWINKSRAKGWYELLEIRKEIDQFGDVIQSHRICHVHGPDTSEVRTLPYEYQAAPDFGTCALDRITDEHNKWSMPKLPPSETVLKGQLTLNPPATAQQMHAGFTVLSHVINSFAMTSREAQYRGHDPNEYTTIGAFYPVRHLRLVFFFPEGYQPAEMRITAHCPTTTSLPTDQWPEDSNETVRVIPSLFFDRDRGCAVFSIERYLPEHQYVLSWTLPPAPDPPWDEAIRARDQLNTLFGLSARERAEVEARLSSIRDEVCQKFLQWPRGRKPRAHLSLLAFDEKAALIRVVFTTMDDEVRNVTFPWGVGVAGWVMRRRRPGFVDTQDSRDAGIYRKVKGIPQDRHLLCIPLPLPTFSDRGSELLLDPTMPCLVAALTCADETGNMGLLKEPLRPANVESGGRQAALSSALAKKLLDLLAEEHLYSADFCFGDGDARREIGR